MVDMKKERKSLLGKPQRIVIPPEIQNTLKKITELNDRTRLLEERMKQTREKLQVLDETFLSKVSDLKDSISNIELKFSSLKKEIEEIREILRRVVKELASTAKIGDVKVLEKYINMIDVSRLVTKDDIERMIEEKIKEMR